MSKLPAGYVNRDGVILPAALANEAAEQIRARILAIKRAEQEVRKQEEHDNVAQDGGVGRRGGWPAPAEGSPGLPFKIFDRQQVIDYQRAVADGRLSRDDTSRAQALVKLLESKGEYRLLATLPADWRQDLSRFDQEYPNFADVIDYLRLKCSLATQSDSVLHFCILLSGPAGTGKSMFAQQIGEWVGGGYTCVRYESAQSGSDLAGSNSFWSNTAPGRPFTMLVEGQYANPTFFLDEIDKVSAKQYDPLGALYGLLEPGTAKGHSDLSWPFLNLDCSRINFIAACNEPGNIPAPILSRLRNFDIREPSIEQGLDHRYQDHR